MVFFNNIVSVKVLQGRFQIAGNKNILFILTDHNVLRCRIVYGFKFFRRRCCCLVVDFHLVSKPPPPLLLSLLDKTSAGAKDK